MTLSGMNAREVLVTGARGKTGREVVAQLAARGVAVRAGSRTPGAASRTVRPVPFDWDEPATWSDAVGGVDAVYLMRPDVEDAPARVAELAAMTPDAHVVLLSEQGAGGLADNSWERGAELAVTDRVRTWTLLRPSWFHQVLTDPRYYVESIRDDGVLSLPTGGARIAFVDARDIAAVAVAALLDPTGSAGAAYEITGPESLTLKEVADLLAAASGRDVVAADPPIEEAVTGLPSWLADQLGGVLDRVRDGVFGRVSGDVEGVTGNPPISVATFVTEYADLWRSAD
ncbi:MAG: NAD(P)H-binding protein [Actinomycetota bacterium]|nr:NAD(P)H-binding protein [Actinomycetota bacterium]